MIWVIREVHGSPVRRYLWETKTVLSNWSLGTALGGDWRTMPDALIPWWEHGQCGAHRYTDRAEAHRVAKRFNAQVVRLVPRTTHPTNNDSAKGE